LVSRTKMFEVDSLRVDMGNPGLGVKYAMPVMKSAGGGVIINTASIFGIRPGLRTTAYSSSKGAANTLTKALALELAPHNIRVNCINPVATDTPIVRRAQADRNWDEWVKTTTKTNTDGAFGQAGRCSLCSVISCF